MTTTAGVQEWACLVIYEFASEPKTERRELLRDTESRCEKLARRLDRAGLIRYEGERAEEPVQAFVAVVRVKDLEP